MFALLFGRPRPRVFPGIGIGAPCPLRVPAFPGVGFGARLAFYGFMPFRVSASVRLASTVPAVTGFRFGRAPHPVASPAGSPLRVGFGPLFRLPRRAFLPGGRIRGSGREALSVTNIKRFLIDCNLSAENFVGILIFVRFAHHALVRTAVDADPERLFEAHLPQVGPVVEGAPGGELLLAE